MIKYTFKFSINLLLGFCLLTANAFGKRQRGPKKKSLKNQQQSITGTNQVQTYQPIYQPMLYSPLSNSFISEVLPPEARERNNREYIENTLSREKKIQEIEVPGGFILLNNATQQEYYAKIRPDTDEVKFVYSNGEVAQTFSGPNDRSNSTTELFYLLQAGGLLDQKYGSIDCNSGNPLHKVDGLQSSCNLVEDSTVDLPEGKDSPFFILSLLKIGEDSLSGNSIRGTPEFCEKCYSEAFNILGGDKGDETAQEIEARLLNKARAAKLKQKTAEIMNAHIFLKSYYQNHKESIERAIKNQATSPIFSGFSLGLQEGSISDQIRQNNLCLKFSEIGFEVESRAQNDNFSIDVSKIPANNSCLKNSKLFFEGISQDLEGRYDDFNMGLSIADNQVFDQSLGSYLDEKINAHSDEYIKKNISALNEEDHQNRIQISARLLGTIETEMKNNLADLKETCLLKDESEKRKKLLLAFFGSYSEGIEDENVILKNAADLVKILSLSNPNFMPFLISSRPVCNLIGNTEKADDINIHELHDFINLNNVADDPEVQKKIDLEHYERLKNASQELCGSFDVFEMEQLICDSNPSLISNSEIAALNLEDPKERIIQNKILCEKEAGLSDEDVILSRNGVAFELNASNFVADTGTQENGQQQIASRSQALLERTASERARSTRRGSRAPASENTNNSEDTNFVSQVLNSSSVGADSAASLTEGRNSVLTGEQINGLSGSLTGENEPSIDSVPKIESLNVNPSLNSKTSPSSTSKDIAALDDVNSFDKQGNSFQDNLNNLLNQSNNLFQQAQTSNFNPNQTVQDLINSQVSESEVMEAVTDNGEIAEDFEKAKQGLADQLITGENAGEALTEAIAGKKEITAEDLGCKKADKSECEASNADLLKQIEDLKAQVTQNAQVKRSKEVDDKSAKRIAELEAEVKKFRKIAEAKVSSGVGSASLSSSQNRSNDSSGETQTIDTGNLFRSSAGGYRSTAGVQAISSPSDKTTVKIVPPRVLQNTQEYINNKDFSIELDQSNGLVLTIKNEGIERYPVEISGVVMGDKGINGIVVQGGAQVPLASLPDASREAVVQFLEERQETLDKVVAEKEEEKKVVEEIQSVAQTRYAEMICAVNPNQNGCNK